MPTPGVPAGSGPATSAQIQPAAGDYLLGPDDVISIHVVNFPEFDAAELVVPPDGKIAVQLLGQIKVAGKTVDQVASELQEGFSDYIKGYSVTVGLVHKRTARAISVYGYAMRGGTIPFHEGTHVLDAIAEMGGAGQTGDLSKVVVTHHDGSSVALDLSNPETKASTPANILLAQGDLVYVPERHDMVNVVGEVVNPGSVTYQDAMRVPEAIKAAGGVKEESADLKAASITRDGKKIPLDLDAYYKGTDSSADIAVEPGDTIEIPEVRNRIYVFGAVGHNGFFNFKPGDRVLDAISAQGGYSANADLRKVSVITIDKQKDLSHIQYVNIDGFLHKGDLKENVALQPGNVIFVPDKKRGFRLVDILTPLAAVNLIRGVGALFGF